jgi:transposase
VEAERGDLVRTSGGPDVEKVRQLLDLRGIGINSAWLYVMEFFGWRAFRNRREVGALAGLVPTPHQSGDEAWERGISKAGNQLHSVDGDSDCLGLASLATPESTQSVV